MGTFRLQTQFDTERNFHESIAVTSTNTRLDKSHIWMSNNNLPADDSDDFGKSVWLSRSSSVNILNNS